MADISKITATDGTTYNVKDATARSRIETLSTNTAAALHDTLPACDLNDVIQAGTYLLTTGKDYQNSPVGWGILEVVNINSVGYTKIQRITQTENIYFRYKTTSTWYEWVKLPSRTEMDAINNRFPVFAVMANSSMSFNVPSQTFGVVFIVGLGGKSAAYMFGCSTSGTISKTAIAEHADITVSQTTNVLTVANGASNSCRVGFMVLSGSVSKVESTANTSSMNGSSLMSSGPINTTEIVTDSDM